MLMPLSGVKYTQIMKEKADHPINSVVEQSTQVSGEVIQEMDMVSRYGQIVPSIKENGTITRQVEEVNLHTKMVMFMRGSGKMICVMVMVYINI